MTEVTGLLLRPSAVKALYHTLTLSLPRLQHNFDTDALDKGILDIRYTSNLLEQVTEQ
jgi:hypothetical protein